MIAKVSFIQAVNSLLIKMLEFLKDLFIQIKLRGFEAGKVGP